MSEQISPTLFCGMTAEEVVNLKKQRDDLLVILKKAINNIEYEEHPFRAWHQEAKDIIKEIEAKS